MATLEALSIKGVRSIPPDGEQCIRFFKPLTLIVGNNGSGKTTIIEALRYACTGSLPPSAKQGIAFVHDPKLKGSSEVVAEVRVKLRNVDGRAFWATRMSKVKTAGKGKRSFASLDCKLEMETAGQQRASVANANATVTARISDLMGVSAAVLDYVIFCHQENSNWPLGEPKDLKTRFDEIFAVSRYTKAMAEIKTARKKFMSDIKVLEEQLKTHSLKRRQRNNLEQEVRENEAEHARLNELVTQLDAKLRTMENDRKHLEDTIRTLKDTFDELKRLTISEQQYQASLARFGQSQNEFSGLSLEELLKRQEDLNLRNRDDDGKKQALELEIDELESAAKRVDEHRLRLVSQNASASNWTKNLAHLKELLTTGIKDFIKQYEAKFKDPDWPTSASVTSNTSFQELERILEIAKNGQEKLARVLAKEQADGAELIAKQKLAQKAKSTVVAELCGTKASLSTHISQLDADIRRVNEELARLQATAPLGQQWNKDEKEKAQRRLQEIEIQDIIPKKQAAILREEAHLAILSHHIESLTRWSQYKFSIVAIETQLENLLTTQTTFLENQKEQLPLLNRSLSMFARYEPETQDILSKYVTSADQPATLSISDLQDSSLMAMVYSSLETRVGMAKQERSMMDEECFDLRAKLTSTGLSIEQLENELAKTKRLLNAKRTSFEKKARALKGIDVAVSDEIMAFLRKEPGETNEVDDADLAALAHPTPSEIQLPGESKLFHMLMDNANLALRNVETRLAVLKTSSDVYTYLIGESQKKAHCAMCLRHINDVEVEDAMVANVARLTSEIPAQIGTAEVEQTAAERLVKSLRPLVPSWDEICNLYAQYATKERLLSQHRARKCILTDSLDTAQSEARSSADRYKQLSEVRNSVERLVHEKRKMDEMAKQVERLLAEREAANMPTIEAPRVMLDARYQLDASITGLLDYRAIKTKNTAEINALQEVLREAYFNTKSTLERLKSEHANLESIRRECETYIRQYQAEFERNLELSAQRTVFEEKLSSLQKELEPKLVEVANVQRRLDNDMKALQEIEQGIAQKEMEQAEIMSQYQSQTSQYVERLRPLTQYFSEAQALQHNLDEANSTEFESEMERLGQELDEVHKKRRAADARMERLTRQDDSSRRRALHDAIQHQDIIRQLAEVKAQIVDQQNLAQGKTQKQLDKELEQLNKDIAKENHIRSVQLGKIDNTAKAVEKKKSELRAQFPALARSDNSMDVTVDVDGEWKKVYVQLETTKMASEDLAVSLDALDKSLMKYHSTKMSDINQTLSELWKQTYKGDDIEYVKIVAENDEGSSHTASATGSNAKALKNFNYRVVMVKEGVELDMRGRCSAGQKVLASLMIRMALAETFCLNCGILALDEPTSNLDQANVESLAESLRSVIESRQRNANFQFIVITHDEEFVKILSRNSWTDEYYKVSKDVRQHSHFRLKNVRDLK